MWYYICMPWEIIKPTSATKRTKQPRATISSSGDNATLLINDALSKELGLNRLTKYTAVRIDKSRNCIGLSFHQKSNTNRFRLGNRTRPSKNRTLDIGALICNVRGTPLPKGTYRLNYSREGEILVLKLEDLDKSKN